ncbi:MAG TPA: DUF4435 domain-containing protein [Gallicola sp.]|nr:DUF4435 domain-containing protein [Gallicola sp.]
MKIRLPNINDEEQYTEGKQSIVLIGANGSGKTRMSVWMDENNPEFDIHRISAQKSLNMPETTSPSDMGKAEELFLYGVNQENKDWLKKTGKKVYRWGDKPETYMLDDYKHLMEYLFTDSYEKSIEYRESHKLGNTDFDNITNLERIKRIWEDVITHRKLEIKAGKIEVIDRDMDTETPNYNGSEMSDGERAIFYFIGEVISAKSNSVIIIDEPENHLHKSILIRLWDAIEKEKPNCIFVYITHSLEFARTRMNSQIIWVKKMVTKERWDYEFVEDLNSANELHLEILGNRQKVMLIEGDRNNSIDIILYSKLFPEYNIISLESCKTVIETVKSYKRTENIHYTEVVGIIDRDRRNDEEIENLQKDNIYALKVAEIENLFMIPKVLETISKNQLKDDFNEKLEEIKEKTFEFLENKKEEQAMLFVRESCLNKVNVELNKNIKEIDKLENNVKSLFDNLNIQEIYEQTINEFNQIIEHKDYIKALKIINNKGLLTYTSVPNYFGWKQKYFMEYAISLISSNSEDGNTLREELKKYIVG